MCIRDSDSALRRLRGATSDQLRALFLARLSTGGTTARGGAGLGLIEMARRSGQALGHRIVPIDAHRSLFVLHAALAQPGARTDEESQAIDRDLGLHQQAIAMGLLVAMRFDGNAAAQETLLRIIEREIPDGVASRRAAQAFLASASWLQEHGLIETALFCFGIEQGRPAMRVIWTAPMPVMMELSARTASIARLSRFELDRLYRSAVTAESGAAPDLGIIELARIQRSRLAIDLLGAEASISIQL